MRFSVQSIYKTEVLQANMRSPWSKSFSQKIGYQAYQRFGQEFEASSLQIDTCVVIHIEEKILEEWRWF